MQYTTLGRTGLVVSRLSFGAMTFGIGQLVPGVTNNIDQEGADRMVNRALDAGINLFDTADVYTNRGSSFGTTGRKLLGLGHAWRRSDRTGRDQSGHECYLLCPVFFGSAN